MRIHAFRRREPIEVDLTPRGSLTLELVQFYLLSQNPPVVVADVDNERHIGMLLGVPEAYREYEPGVALHIPTAEEREREERERLRLAEEERLRQEEQRRLDTEAAEAERQKKANEAGVLLGSGVQPAIIDLTGSKTVPLGDVVTAAHLASSLTVAEWNELQAEEREAMISRQIEAMTIQAETEEQEAQDRLAEQVRKDQAAAKAAADAAAAQGGTATSAEAEADTNAGAGGQDADTKPDATADQPEKFVLIGPNDERIDLKTMDDDALRALAKQYGAAARKGVAGDDLRQHIVDKLAPEQK